MATRRRAAKASGNLKSSAVKANADQAAGKVAAAAVGSGVTNRDFWVVAAAAIVAALCAALVHGFN